MLVIPGAVGKDTCDGVTRRELLRVGGSAMLGLSLAGILRTETGRRAPASTGAGFGKAKSVILVYLQGGPSHLDLWDPKDNVPDNVKQRLQADPHQDCPALQVHRTAAEARPGHRQDHDDPLDELHARSACSITRPPSTRC